MKVSLNWIKEYLDFELPPIDELVERIGAQLGAVEEVDDFGEKHKGAVIVKVVECEPLETSDHLHRCLIDDNGKVSDVERNDRGFVQVLCGAPNVHKDMLAAWLAPGVTVPESIGKDPFVIGNRTIRGSVSHGMLASARELALGDNHEGVLDLSKEDVKPGDDFAETYKLNDFIIDIENKMFTHRPDCFGILGVAREIAGILGHQFKSPNWYLQPLHEALRVDGTPLPLRIRNEIPELVPRFVAVPLNTITMGPSPFWLQTYLLRCGVRPISNVVDVTNYIMLLTGQPMHAYDYDKVKALSGGDEASIVVRYPHPGEKITLLNGKTIEPRDEAMMVATDERLICVGGSMGGTETEVDESTTSVILEAANWDMYSIRRTSMAHGIFTDAVTRFNKGQSPLQNDVVTAKAVEMLRELAGATVAGPLVDEEYGNAQNRERRWVHPPVPVMTGFINTRLGLKLSAAEIKQLLENVECIADVSDDTVTITAPFWRTDIELREDVVEEVGRLYGFDRLPLELPKRSIEPATKNAGLELKSRIRNVLAKAGANEVLTYSFVHGDLLKKAGQDPKNAFQVSNALSPDLQYYRLSLMPSLLDKVHPNIKAGVSEFALFEIGKSHLVDQEGDEGLPREDELVALVVTAADKLKKSGAPYYAAKQYLEALVSAPLSYKPVPADMQVYDITKLYNMNRSAFVYAGEMFLGLVGEFRAAVTNALKLPKYCAGFELDLGALASILGGSSYVPLSRFPAVWQDLTLKVV
ncbi:MAG TPA: phenylalanine--tRNA ligase subunit beta, partial [Verrucomicrobiae bacterium]|nr:phenylalanine--tRNA ligase subunit beta [Verrucomicrobiae bacterium]